ncbi:transcriptional regulator [Candidatus Parabeggiatoa sp. HSG14]|uniref:transcriptional regulator n=1 Tax=Candidatus Parabeggiatoa sp. HSG14 TaxID=3055593 RepID=UPI0025A748BF|nr:transcriptional regulator [Thiotrichales bacterium HSG14]
MHVISRKALSQFWELYPDSKNALSIYNEEQYDVAISRLNNLIDEVGTNERHPLYGLLDMLGMVIHAYEEKHYPMPECSGIGMLKFFMDEQGLISADLPEIGEQGVVLEILNGNRVLDANQISALSKRFNVSPVVFI